MYRIMIVEDDEKIRRIISESLRKWRYDVFEVSDFSHVLNDFTSSEPHLVLMDINLPFLDGYHWCAQIRTISKVPIVFLSSRTQNMDMIMAMNMGGDDYVQKPFDLDVLVAKVNAIFRRKYTYDADQNNLELTHRGLCFFLANSTVQYQNEVIELTRNEFILLQLMMRSIGKIIARDELMQALWNNDQFVDDNTLTVNVNRLRKKITQLGLEQFIVTRKGMGYLIE